MQFGGAQLSEPMRMSKSTSKRANELLYFLRLPLLSTVLVGRPELLIRDPVKPFLGARGLFWHWSQVRIPGTSLAVAYCKQARFLDSLLHNRRFSSALGGAQAAPTMRHGGTERSVSRVFTSC